MAISLTKSQTGMRRLTEAESTLMNQLTEVWMKNAELRKKNVKLTEQIAWLKEHNRQLCDQLDHRVRLDRLFPRATSG